jgi:hypothetical protein
MFFWDLPDPFLVQKKVPGVRQAPTLEHQHAPISARNREFLPWHCLLLGQNPAKRTGDFE